MANKMLIDASHPEETRVVVLRGNRVEEFDFESASKRQLRGNIYLAKVTRVEPSLQAAFVEYGGNRHGFLAFSEIHPDYYQIPVADRLALIEEEARAHAQEEDEERGNNQNQQRRGRRRRPERFQRRRRPDEAVTGAADEHAPATDENGVHEHDGSEHAMVETHESVEAHESHDAPDASAESHEVHADAPAHEAHHEAPASEPANESHEPAHEAPVAVETAPVKEAPAPAAENAPVEAETVTHNEAPLVAGEEHHEAETEGADHGDGHETPVEAREPREAESDEEDDDEDEEAEEEVVEQIGGDAMEEMPRRQHRSRKQYKIQEVIKRRQVLLVQVVKEERGSKGAALTTYLSLAGRYSVLMPNTARGGGISRKITDSTDRKRLKEIAGALEVPEGMGVILRTAGASRTPAEVGRDFEYLLRMWESVRELTLQSSAPSLVYEEGSLIKRSIRDLYNKEIDEVVVSGDVGYQEARDYMRMLMPSHEKNVRKWTEPAALYAKTGVEAQLDGIFSNTVTLKSGGYLVINQAEALVAIDVNSGRSTREHNIEDTALRTNLEAADEVARQLRLRDLAGLIVVDFIDMEEHRNNRAVERRIKDALKNDRARIQVGRISHFGLLEMSRQRMRSGLIEGSTVVCPHCAGAGHMRSTASIALHTLRAIEDTLARSATHNIIVRARTEVALYILNHKRASLSDIEQRFGVAVIIAADDTLTGMIYHAIERGELASPPVAFQRSQSVRIDSVAPPPEYDEPMDEGSAEDDAGLEAEDAEGEGGEPANGAREDDPRKRRRRRRRRGRGERYGEGAFQGANAPQPSDNGLEFVARIGGDLPGGVEDQPMSDGEVDETEAEAFDAEQSGDGEGQSSEGGRQSRSRRGGRRRRGGDRGEGRGWRPREDGEPSSEGDAAPAAESFAPAAEHDEAPRFFHDPVVAVTAPVEAPIHVTPEPAAEPVIAHDQAPVVAATPEPVVESAPKASEPPPAYIAPLPEAPVDPSRPKRSGWWQRAKQTFGGN